MTNLLQAFTAALLHFAWQGCLVFALLRVALYVLRTHNPNVRYLAACFALAALAIAPLVTTLVLYRPPAMAANFAIPPAALIDVATPPRPSQIAMLQPWALPVWAFGVFLFSLRMIAASVQVAGLRRRGLPAPAAVIVLAETLATRMRLRARAHVLVSEWTGGPSLVGWLRPVILLPASVLAGLTPEQLESILAHELAHIRRHDYLVNWIQMTIETLLFYHPAVWWISGRIRHERELCCDDLAVSVSQGPLCYARALTALEKMRSVAPAAALGSTDGALLYRIRRIAGATAGEYAPSRATIALAAALACAGLIFGVDRVRAQSEPARAYLAQGDTLLRAGSSEQALQTYLAGLAANPGDRATFQKRIIETLVRMERKQEAADVNAQLLKEHPDDTDALAFDASLLLERGNLAGAVAQLQRVLERDPGNPVAHLDLGRAYAQQSDTGSARREIEEALRLRPDFTRARQALERLNAGEDAATVEANRAALTTQFLRDEVDAAKKRVADLLAQQVRDENAIREARRHMLESTLRLNAATNAGAPAGRKLAVIDGDARIELPVHIGDTLTRESVAAVFAAAGDAHIAVFTLRKDGTVQLTIRRR